MLSGNNNNQKNFLNPRSGRRYRKTQLNGIHRKPQAELPQVCIQRSKGELTAVNMICTLRNVHAHPMHANRRGHFLDLYAVLLTHNGGYIGWDKASACICDLI